jgi:PAS domain S-box-containing protein
MSASHAETVRREAVERLQRRHPAGLDIDPHDLQSLVHELEVYQVELEVQNEELRRAQAELSEAHNRYLELYEFAPVGYLTLDDGRVITRANRPAAGLCGKERNELIGRRIQSLFVAEDADVCYIHLNECAAARHERRTELRLQRRGGEPLWVQVATCAVFDPDGRPAGYRMTLTDIAVRKKAEEALRHAKSDLERRVAERTADLSRTVEMLQDEAARRELAEGVLRERSQQLTRLASELALAEQRERRRLAAVLHDNLQQLLVAARFQLGALRRRGEEKDRRAVDGVQELLEESIEVSRSLTGELSPPILYEGGLIAGLEWLATWMERKHGLSVELRTEAAAMPESDDMTVLLFESVRELLLNAVKHSGVKRAEVNLCSLGEQVELTVSDSGAGFDPQLATRHAEGGGFGLFSIRERLALLGGSLKIDSAPGRGSRFALRAPRRSPAIEEPAPSRAGIRISRAGPVARKGGERRAVRVVLADDHVVLRQALSHLLRDEGDIEVVAEASDGKTAVEMARRYRPDVVTMDVNMPEMDGVEATRIIHGELPEVKVIGLSMFDGGERAEAMREAGAVKYISKAGPADELVAAIRDCVPRRSARK